MRFSFRAERRRACSSSFDSDSVASRVRCVALDRTGASAVPKLLARTTFTESTLIPWLSSARVSAARSRPRAASAPASAALIVTRMAPSFRSTTKATSPKSPPSTRTIKRFSEASPSLVPAATRPFAAPAWVSELPVAGVRSPTPGCQPLGVSVVGGVIALGARADNCIPTRVAQRSACSSVVFLVVCAPVRALVSLGCGACAEPVGHAIVHLFISASIRGETLRRELVFQSARNAFLLSALFRADTCR